MTTATTLGDAVFSLNMTRGEDFLYKSKVDFGGKVAKASFRVNFLVPLLAILVRMRTRRELEPKSPKPPVPPPLDPNSNGSQQPATVTFNPADIQVETR
ncbi:noncompact myelin-associated protein [Cricetulus griseus]|uniref:noncompact myelin-associated protein n=1 Tax=Cricetulus griseus TaxID=10029 RepID=UPI00022F4E87|nr:noncompact myelin-associated protein [Cricetulus griseus]